MPTAVAGIKDAILSTWKATTALSSVYFIIDGFGESSESASTIVMLGSNGDPDEIAQTEWQQMWADIAHTRRYESGTIPCCVVAQDGTTDVTSLQDIANTLIVACLSPFLADTTLGGKAFTTEVNEGTARTIANSQGTAVIVPFVISYWTQV